jgi:hypothetical protein
LGSTPRFTLSYPALTDAPNGPAQLQELAEDVEGWLCRAFPCTSTSRPTGVGAGFLIRESDTGNVMIWSGSSWGQVAGAVTSGGGGGGGGTTTSIGTVSATYAGAAAQAISPSTDTVVAFPTAQVTASEVTRNISGAGHSFTLGQTRLWMITATVRFAAALGSGRTVELRAGGSVLAKQGTAEVDAAYTANVACTRRLNAGAVITVVVRHDKTGGIALEPNGGEYVHIDFGGV